jgi:transposase-like protein
MSEGGPGSPSRFSEEDKLAIVEEGEKHGAKVVCAKYGFSDSTYRLWRYKAKGIQPRKWRSPEEKLRILEESYQNGITYKT